MKKLILIYQRYVFKIPIKTVKKKKLKINNNLISTKKKTHVVFLCCFFKLIKTQKTKNAANI